MADSPEPNELVGLFNSLPPILQGIFVMGAGIGVGVVLYRRFAKRLKLEPEEPRPFAIGEPTAIADMTSVKQLVQNVDLLTLQMMKTEVALGSYADGFASLISGVAKLADIAGEMLTDMKLERQAREDEEVRSRYREEGRKQALEDIKTKRAARRRSTARRTTAEKKPTS